MDREIGLVLAGGGARGAYEAGALSVMLPALERRGERPTVLVGTSVGALNATYLAGAAHLPAEQAADELLARWREATKGEVIRPILLRQAPLTVLRYAGEILSLPGVRLSSLLDPRPLEGNLRRWIDWPALRENIDEQRIDVVSIVATAARSGRSVLFCDGCHSRELHRSHVIDYVRASLTVEHVRASSAIPILFPPVRVETPTEARGWYFDGGTRLNAPIKPALDLGADRVMVIATESVEALSNEDGRHDGEPPDFGDGALHLLQGALVDPLIEDLRQLADVNTFFTDGDPHLHSYRRARDKPPYREVPYVFVGPAQPGAIGALALEVFRSRYRGLRALRSPEMVLLNRLLGGAGPTHGDLLSYLFFDREFIDALIDMGRQDAGRCLAAKPDDPWRRELLDSFARQPSSSRPPER